MFYTLDQAPRLQNVFMLNSANHEIFSAYKYETANNRGYETFFMLNSAEYEYFLANKSPIINNCKLFHA